MYHFPAKHRLKVRDHLRPLDTNLKGLRRAADGERKKNGYDFCSFLKGDAADYIFELPDFSELSFRQLLERLERRFGDRRRESFYLTRLEARRLGRLEKHSRVCR